MKNNHYELWILLVIVGMLISAGGCSNLLPKEPSAKFVYYSEMGNENDSYFDVQKFNGEMDREFFREQKVWGFFFAIPAAVIFPYEYLAFSSVPYIPAVPYIPGI